MSYVQNKKIISLFIMAGFLLINFLTLAETLTEEEKVCKEAMPSVVWITQTRSAGSGFIIDKEGHIITNFHVIAGKSSLEKTIDTAKRLAVKLNDEKIYSAKIISYDSEFDIALLKIENKENNFPPIKLGDSDKINVGDKAIALGGPLGVRDTATFGSISNAKRSRDIRREIQSGFNAIQMDAPINPGNSGGPLINIKGEVVGINASVAMSFFGNEGIGFAIPINIAKMLVGKWMAGEKFERASFGVELNTLSVELAKYLKLQKGILVSGIYKYADNEDSQFKEGDIIVEFNGEQVPLANTNEDVNDFELKVIKTGVGKNVKVKIIRPSCDATQELSFEAVLKKRPKMDFEVERKNFEELGFVAGEITQDKYLEGKVSAPKGVVVYLVSDGSSAEKSGIKANDVIESVDNEKIQNIDELNNVISSVLKKNKEKILIKLKRYKDSLPVILKLNYQLKDKKAVLILPDAVDKNQYKILAGKLESAGCKVIRISAADQFNVGEEKIPADLKLDKLDKKDYDAIIFMSGDISGYEKNPKTNEIIKDAAENKKLIIAIGNAPLLLVKSKVNGIFDKKMTIDENEEKAFKDAGGNFTGKDTEIDENVVTTTAKDEENLKNFAKILVQLLIKK